MNKEEGKDLIVQSMGYILGAFLDCGHSIEEWDEIMNIATKKIKEDQKDDTRKKKANRRTGKGR